MNYLYYQFWTKESLSFSEAVARKCSIKKLRIKFCQSSLATLLKKRFGHRWISVNLAKFFKKPILQNTCEWLVLDFAQFYMSHSIIYFIKRNSKKGNYYFLNVFNRISTSENYRQKKLLDSKMQLFVIFSSEELDLKSFIRAWEPAWSEWMNEYLWNTSNKMQTNNYQVKVYFWANLLKVMILVM